MDDIWMLKQRIYLLINRQRAACKESAKHSLDWLSVRIEQLEEELRWAEFIRYCNTSCWRYRC